jgi:hypothetical protein
MKNKQNGFIALFSVIIISFVLILVATTLAFSGFFTRFNILDSESKSRSAYLAEACVESARLALAENKNFAGNNTVHIDPDSCDYSVIGSPTTIISHSAVNDANTYLRVVVSVNNSSIPIVSFEELANYP